MAPPDYVYIVCLGREHPRLIWLSTSEPAERGSEPLT